MIQAAVEALKPGSTQYVDIVAAIQEDHIRVAKELLRTSEIVEELVRDIQTECARLGALLAAAQVSWARRVGWTTRADDGYRHSMKLAQRRRML